MGTRQGRSPAVLLGAEGFPGGERSLLVADPQEEVQLLGGDVDGLRQAFSSTRGRDGVWLGYLSYDFGLPFVKETPSGSPIAPGWPAFSSLLPPMPLGDPQGRSMCQRNQRPAFCFAADEPDQIHKERVEALHPGLVHGEVYQANLTRAFRAEAVDGASLFLSLAAHSPAPYAAYLPTPLVNSSATPPNSSELERKGDPANQSHQGDSTGGADSASDDLNAKRCWLTRKSEPST